jgi:hypothetical protein
MRGISLLLKKAYKKSLNKAEGNVTKVASNNYAVQMQGETEIEVRN